MAEAEEEAIAPRAGAIARELIAAAGPGGQNVNKVATAVQLRLDIYALRLAPAVFARFKLLAGSRLTSGGELVLTARRFRTPGSQSRRCPRAHDRIDPRCP